MGSADGAEGRRSTALRRRAVPYFLLGPGTIWLVLFFVVPLYYMGKLSLESGIIGALRIQLALGELQRRALALRHPVRPLLRVRGGGDAARAGDRLSARLRDRLQGGALAQRDAVRGGRAVLHHLPDPDHRLGDDPLRRKPGDRSAARRSGSLRAATSSPPRRRDRRPHLQLPALHDPADLRQPRADRRAADRGGEGPLQLGHPGLPAGDAAALGARGSSPAPCSPSSRPRATTSTPSSSAAPATG